MGLRYLVAIAPDRQPIPSAVHNAIMRAGLERVAFGNGFQLFLSLPNCWARLDAAHGVVIGDLFRRGSDRNTIATCGGDVAADACDFETLLATHWGGYLAVSYQGEAVALMRDPSGTLPAYYVQQNGVWYFASDAPLLVEAGLLTPRLDWSRVAWSLYSGDLADESTALDGLKQILPGMAIMLNDQQGQARLCWSPWDHVEAEHFDAEAMRTTTVGCVQAWASRFSSILVGVSGGLDSSIVASSLRTEGQLRSVTISTDDVHGDEAHYAAELCSALDVSLSAERYELCNVDLSRSSLSHRPLPGGMAQLQAYDAAVIEVARQHGATAFFSGLGGDNVFYFTKSARALVDRYLAEGPSPKLLSTMADICRLTGASPWMVMREALKVPRAPGSKYRWRVDGRLLNADVIAQLDTRSVRHPWLEGPADCLPGKQAHIAMLVRAHSYLECHDRRLPFASVHPLMSQPIIEQCLTATSWLACAGGMDRAHARRAFAADIPPTLLSRRVKGGPDGFAFKIIRSHIEVIREMLLDGLLAREHIIDRFSVERALSEQNLARGTDYIRILLLLDTEAWARNWISAAPHQHHAMVI